VVHTQERNEEYRLLRATDAAIALILDGALQTTPGALVIERLVATMVDATGYGTSDPVGTVDRAADALNEHARLFRTARANKDEPAVRALLGETVQTAVMLYEYNELEGADLTDLPPFQLEPFARRLRIFLRNRDLTGTAVARQLGVPQHQLHHWSNGRSKPSVEQRAKLAEALRCAPTWMHEDLDNTAVTALYKFRSCPCQHKDALRVSPLDSLEMRTGDAVSWGLQCSKCSQHYALDTDGSLIAIPTCHDAIGRELKDPWPTSIWQRTHRPE
jgi:transcriptional regulator with XRE-family HTH domain